MKTRNIILGAIYILYRRQEYNELISSGFLRLFRTSGFCHILHTVNSEKRGLILIDTE